MNRQERPIKPCPLCGDKESFIFFDDRGYSVKCSYKYCGCRINFFSKREKAIEVWNRRNKEESEVQNEY